MKKIQQLMKNKVVLIRKKLNKIALKKVRNLGLVFIFWSLSENDCKIEDFTALFLRLLLSIFLIL
jgi:hypothetical protein